VIGHKEGTTRKIDPSFSMAAFRDAVAARLAHAPGWNPNKEDDVALSTDDINRIAAAVYTKLLTTDGVIESPAGAPDHAANPFWTWESYIKFTYAKLAEIETALAQKES